MAFTHRGGVEMIERAMIEAGLEEKWNETCISAAPRCSLDHLGKGELPLPPTFSLQYSPIHVP